MNTKIHSKPDFSITHPVDQVGIEDRVARFNTRSIKKESKNFALKLALSMVDLTTLEGMDSPGKVRQLCYKAMHPHESLPDIPAVAAVCVYPSFVAIAKEALRGSGVKVASVATAFPSGHATLKAKIDEVTYVVGEGADEIDMVISRGAFFPRGLQFCFR
jgi:deoxyribose-phosphate aldolase